MAGRRETVLTVSAVWRVCVVLCLLLGFIGTSVAEQSKVYDIDLRAQSLADALNGLSEQTGAPIVFPYDLVKDRKASPVIGRFTLLEALNALLAQTGLSGGLSEKGVLMISAAKSGAPESVGSPAKHDQVNQNMNKTKAAHPLGIAAFFASIGAAFSASAQDTSREQADIQDVVITAQKREERLQDVPIPVTVLNTNELADNGQALLRDYYASVPGLIVTPGFYGDQNLSIRGVTTGGFTNPTVGVTVDDVPFGGSTNDIGGFEVPDFDPGDLARVEVLRGPQGTVYGANSMGGLIKYVTKDPSTDGFSGRLETGTSSVFNGAEPGFNLRGSANIPLSDTLAVRVSGFRRQDPGYINNVTSGLDGVNEVEAYGGRLAALWRPSQDFSLKLSALYQGTQGNGENEVDVLPGLGDLQQNYIPGTGRFDRTVEAYSATLKYKMGSTELTSVSGYNVDRFRDSIDSTFYYGSTNQGLFGFGGAPYYLSNPLTKFTQEIRLAGLIGTGFEWLVGGFYTHETNGDSEQVITASNPDNGQQVGVLRDAIIRDRFEEYAGFADLTYHVTEQFDIQVGGRESQNRVTVGPNVETGPYTELFEGAASPNLTPRVESKADIFTYLVTPQFKVSPDLMVYARLASGYRPGGPNTFTFAGAPAEYSPDKTQNYEIGAKGDFLDHMLSVDASLYYIDWKNIQLQARSPAGLTYSTNGSEAKSEGVELAVTSKPLSSLTIAAWVSYDDAVLTRDFPANSTVYGVTGDRLPNSSRFSGNVSVEQDFPLWNSATGFVGAMASYVGQRESVFTATPQRQDFPGYTKTDLRGGVKYDSWTTNFYVNNVANVRGVLDGGAGYFLPYAFIYIQPRTVGLTISKTF